MTTVTFGAKQRPSGAWIGFYTENGKTRYMDHLIKKTEKGAIAVAMRAYESR